MSTLRESNVKEPNYSQQFKAFRGMTDQAEIQSDIVSCHLLEALEAHSPARELKVLSVGCGDGVMDNMILTNSKQTTFIERKRVSLAEACLPDNRPATASVYLCCINNCKSQFGTQCAYRKKEHLPHQ